MKFLQIIILVVAIIGCTVSKAQQDPLYYIKEQADYIPAPSYSQEDGRKYNSEKMWDHPDFGKMTFASPLDKNVVEDISKRKLDERYYVDLDDPTFFYIEKSNIPINYYDQDSVLRAIDYSLHQTSDGFAAKNQPFPTAVNTIENFTSLASPNGSIQMNHDRVKITYMDNSTATFVADWSDIKITNFKVYITEIFPGIDKKLSFHEGAVKSEYIVKQNMNYKTIEFIDELTLDENLEVIINDDSRLTRYYVQFKDMESGEIMILGHPALTHDSSNGRTSWLSDYALNGNELSVICDSASLNQSGLVYPLIVDPLFTAVGPVAGNFLGSDLAPASCTQNLNIVYPGGSTPWDASLTWNVLADFCGLIWVNFGFFSDCWMSDTQLWFTSGCGGASPTGAPGIIWTCSPLIPACNNIGNWNPTLNFGDDPSTMTLVQCYAPSCANQNITITANLNRLVCAGGFQAPFGNIDNCLATAGNSVCVTMTAWSVTVQGRSVETLGNTVTGNGSQNIYDADCVGTQLLDPTPLYGVPGYTYVWNPGGATTPTLTVPGTVSTYTVDVTDACGNTVTATFDIGCPLADDELSVNASRKGQEVEVQWTTTTEKELSHFVIERSYDGEEWIEIGTTEATGNSDIQQNYKTFDPQPIVGMNYYRVNQHHADGTFGYSETINVVFREEFTIFPNPAENELTVEIPGTIYEGSELVITDIMGRVIYRERVEANSSSIDLSEFDSGNYFIRLERDGNVREVQRLTIK